MPETLAAVTVSQVLAATSAAVAIGGSAIGHQDAVKAQKQQANAASMRARADAITQQRERATQIRQARIAAASVDSNTNAAGAQGSSGQAGALGSLQTQSASNVNYLDTTGALTAGSNAALTKANYYGEQSSVFSSIGQIGFGLAGYAGGDGSSSINDFADKHLGTKGGGVFS